jgi:hypothetical protein
LIEGPKNFRRCKGLSLENVSLPNALETLWDCEDVSLRNVKAKGEYLAMNAKNGTFGDYLGVRRNDYPLKGGMTFSNYCFAGAAGVIWACQFAFLKMGEPLCGEKAYVGFAIVMGASVFFSSFLGIFLGEWKGTGARTKGLLATGLALLAASILLPVVAR